MSDDSIIISIQNLYHSLINLRNSMIIVNQIYNVDNAIQMLDRFLDIIETRAPNSDELRMSLLQLINLRLRVERLIDDDNVKIMLNLINVSIEDLRTLQDEYRRI